MPVNFYCHKLSPIDKQKYFQNLILVYELLPFMKEYAFQ